MEEATVRARPLRRTYRGGKGASEMLTLTTWTSKQQGFVRVQGFFDVFCGSGWMHREPLDVRGDAEQHAGKTPGDVIDALVAEWLEWDYPGCTCEWTLDPDVFTGSLVEPALA